MAEALRLRRDALRTPLGELLLFADDAARLRAVGFGDREKQLLMPFARQPGAYRVDRARDPGGLTSRLGAYFEGDLTAIDLLPVEMTGTPFQRAVWQALRAIPCGTTLSYSDLARRIGRPSAVRAVGLANGANPVSIVVPCHRVIGADGTLTGYGGGMPRKQWLLSHEGARGTAPLFPGLFTASAHR